MTFFVARLYFSISSWTVITHKVRWGSLFIRLRGQVYLSGDIGEFLYQVTLRSIFHIQPKIDHVITVCAPKMHLSHITPSGTLSVPRITFSFSFHPSLDGKTSRLRPAQQAIWQLHTAVSLCWDLPVVWCDLLCSITCHQRPGVRSDSLSSTTTYDDRPLYNNGKLHIVTTSHYHGRPLNLSYRRPLIMGDNLFWQWLLVIGANLAQYLSWEISSGQVQLYNAMTIRWIHSIAQCSLPVAVSEDWPAWPLFFGDGSYLPLFLSVSNWQRQHYVLRHINY